MSQTLSPGFLAEFQHESQTTRRLFERIPEEKFDWKPHEKSFSLKELALHIGNIPNWAPMVMDRAELDFEAETFEPPTADSLEELLNGFEEGVKAFQACLEGRNDEDFMVPWAMKRGDQVLLQMPRVAVIRGFILSHLIHHRGQLSVYLRQLDVPLPSMYGPTADDPGNF